MSLKTSQKDLNKNEITQTVYTASTNLPNCKHEFVRKGRNVECTKCSFGLLDDPMRPIDIKQLNEAF